MEKLRGKWVEVQGYKHDGRMHRIWDSTYVIDETDEYVVVSSKKVKVIEHDFRIWYTKEPAIMVFFKDKWWDFNFVIFLCNIDNKCSITYSRKPLVFNLGNNLVTIFFGVTFP